MRWTSEKPTAPGWYWQRYVGDSRGSVVSIWWNSGCSTPRAGDTLYLHDGRPLAGMETSEWSDMPIAPPDDSDSGHCTRCGESDTAMRNGRCQNVPASEHAWSR